MKSCIAVLSVLVCVCACSKQVSEEATGPAVCPVYVSPKLVEEALAGSWNMVEQRADPGNGSGSWHQTNNHEVITFDKGVYSSTNTTVPYNRYRITALDTIELYNTTQSNTRKLAIQLLNKDSLTYYEGWPWCGGPSGSKFVRIAK